MQIALRALTMLSVLLPLTACGAGPNAAPPQPEAQRLAPSAPELGSIPGSPAIPETEGAPADERDDAEDDTSGMVIEPPPIESEADMMRTPPATGTEEDMVLTPPQVEPQPPRPADDSTVQEVQR